MDYLSLFLIFLKIGASIFGGGYSILPIIERELIKKRGWLTHDELMDYFTISQITPGVIAVNIATFIGYRRKGVLGGIIATVALVIPGVFLMIIISRFFKYFAEYGIVNHAFAGIRIAVCALLLDTIYKLFKGLIKNIKSIIVCLLSFFLSAILSFSPVYIVIGAGVAGALFFRPKISVKEGENNP